MQHKSKQIPQKNMEQSGGNFLNKQRREEKGFVNK